MSGWSYKLGKLLLPLTLAFSAAAAPPSASAPKAPAAPHQMPVSGETLWKTEYLDTVISLQKCRDENVCGYIYWVNPDDSRIFDFFGDPEKRSGLSSAFSLDYDPAAAATDVLSVCGHSPKTDFSQVDDKKWRGTMELQGMGKTARVDVTNVNDNELRVVSKIGPFSKTETWRRIAPGDPRYPRCAQPPFLPK